MTSCLPSYDEAMNELKKLEHEGMTPEVKTKVYTTMANKTSSSKNDIIEEVNKLASRAVATDQAFEHIRTQLTVVDLNDYKDKYGQPIAKFQPTWVKYQKRYTNLLWGSRTAATTTEAYLLDFTRVVIPLILQPDSTYEDNLQDLQAFIKRRNPVSNKFDDDDFTKLQKDVEEFTATFSTFANDEGAKLTAEIKDLKDKITALNKELVDLKKLVKQMAIALGVTAGAAAGGIIAALTCLGPLAPTAVISILVAGTIAAIGELSQLIVALTRMADVESEIAEKQRQIDSANQQLELLGKLKSMLQRCAEEGDEMFGRLENFTSIWSSVAQDAQLIMDSNLANVHTDKTVQARIELIASSYAGVADALRFYATFIDQSDVPQQDI